MKGLITVADAAVTDAKAGKLSALGAFWSTLSDGKRDVDVVFVLRLDQHELGAHDVRISLVPLIDSERESMAETAAELIVEPKDPVSPMPGLPAVFANTVRLSGVELEPGLYGWKLVVDGELLDEWIFAVTPRAT